MNLDKVNALKQKGNDAFKMGKMLDAIDSYSGAINLAGEEDQSLKCVLHSNRAQVMLKEKRYGEALADAEESLKYDPSFMKSVLRRATANVKLGNNEKAVKDLREVLKHEPKNLSAKELMAEVSSPDQMNVNFASTYVGHYLRRASTVGNASFAQIFMGMRKKLPRIMFLSSKGVPFLQRVLNGFVVEKAYGQLSLLTLPQWFGSKCLKASPRNIHMPTVVSDSILKLILEVFHPTVRLRIKSNECVQRYGTLYKFASISYLSDDVSSTSHTNSEALKIIEKCSNILTRLLYLPEIVKLEDKAFPALDTLLVVGSSVMDTGFLKVWKKQDWAIRTLVFRDRYPDLMNFERFGGQISKQVVTLHMPFMDANADLLHANQLSRIKQDLGTLKKVFPNLVEVVGKFGFVWPNNVFMQNVSRVLKKYIAYLTKNINDNVKPEWCEKLKIYVMFIGQYTFIETSQFDMGLLKRIVEECRREMDWLDHISLHGPSPILFDWFEMVCSPAIINISTKHADFEIVFHFSPLE